MSEKAFEGIMVPLLMPLDEHENIVENELAEHVNFLLDRGVQGFLAPSGTGEFFNLSFEARRKVVEIVVREAQGKALVVALVGECGTLNTLAYVKAAKEAGADAVMATPPYYTHVDQRALKYHFSTIADKGGLPLWLYHQPGETKLTIEPETVLELSQHPNIVGIKVASGNDLVYYHRLVRLLRGNSTFSILIAEDHSNLPALMLGGQGSVATLGNIIPEEFVSLWQAVRERSIAEARRAQERIMECFELLIQVQSGNYQSSCKLILRERGVFSSDRCSAPLGSLAEQERNQIVKHAKKFVLC